MSSEAALMVDDALSASVVLFSFFSSFLDFLGQKKIFWKKGANGGRERGSIRSLDTSR